MNLAPQVGFSGVVLYATPFLMSHVSKEKLLSAYIREGKLLCIMWDRFNTFQEIMPLGQVQYTC